MLLSLTVSYLSLSPISCLPRLSEQVYDPESAIAGPLCSDPTEQIAEAYYRGIRDGLCRRPQANARTGLKVGHVKVCKVRLVVAGVGVIKWWPVKPVKSFDEHAIVRTHNPKPGSVPLSVPLHAPRAKPHDMLCPFGLDACRVGVEASCTADVGNGFQGRKLPPSPQATTVSISPIPLSTQH